MLALGSCRFFHLPPLQLVNLKWNNMYTVYANNLFSAQPFPPTLRSLSFNGSWHDQLPKVNNLTSLTLSGYHEGTSAETFRRVMLNNPFLETLSVRWINFKHDSNGPPVDLLNIKSFSIASPHWILPTLIRVPALRRISSLLLSPTDLRLAGFKFYATGDGIEFTARSDLHTFTEIWEDFTKDARPSIRHVRIEDPEKLVAGWDEGSAVFTVFLRDAHTLEVGSICSRCWCSDFWGYLKLLGPQLKTIRFEIPEETEPFRGSEEYWDWGGGWLDAIEDLVVYRFENGRPFSSVERMVVSDGETANRQQEFVWRWFYNDRRLDRYVQHE